jgi:hypothetical protein
MFNAYHHISDSMFGSDDFIALRQIGRIPVVRIGEK